MTDIVVANYPSLEGGEMLCSKLNLGSNIAPIISDDGVYVAWPISIKTYSPNDVIFRGSVEDFNVWKYENGWIKNEEEL